MPNDGFRPVRFILNLDAVDAVKAADALVTFLDRVWNRMRDPETGWWFVVARLSPNLTAEGSLADDSQETRARHNRHDGQPTRLQSRSLRQFIAEIRIEDLWYPCQASASHFTNLPERLRIRRATSRLRIPRQPN